MKLAIVILAAGMGTRMKSNLPKVLHKLFDIPLLQYVVDSSLRLRPDKIVVVIGKNQDIIKETLRKDSNICYAVQEKPLGTAHTLISALSALKDFNGTVLVLNGDVPLITPETLRGFLSTHTKNRNSLSALSFMVKGNTAYGRIVRDKTTGHAVRIVEAKDATEVELAIMEVNSGVYAIQATALPLLLNIKINKLKGEYYITDLFEEVLRHKQKADIYPIGTEDEFHGINTRIELSQAHESLRNRHVKHLLNNGVNFIDINTAYIHPSVSIGRETTVYPNVFIHGNTKIGKGCTIYPNVRIIDCTINNGVVIKDSSLIEESFVDKNAQLGPFAHIRPGCKIGPSVKIGNFVELKKSSVGKGTKAMHLSYLGDAVIGSGVNIGAGTITCNYDGVNKHQTIIENNVFVGSDTQLVAPVRINKGSYIGAGTTLTQDVPEHSLAISRVRQTNIIDWAKKRFKKPSKH